MYGIVPGGFVRVACQLDYQYPLYDEKISNYVIRQKKKYGIEDDNK